MAGNISSKMIQNRSIKEVFAQKEQYFIIALTGKVGVGCSQVAKRMTKSVEELLPSYPQPSLEGMDNDLEREIRLVRRFYAKHGQKFRVIRVREVIASYLLESKEAWNRIEIAYDETKNGNGNDTLWKLCIDKMVKNNRNYANCDLNDLDNAIKHNVSAFSQIEASSDVETRKAAVNYITEWLPQFVEALHEILGKKYTPIFQQFGNELRFFGALDAKQNKQEEYFWQEESLRRFENFEQDSNDSAEYHHSPIYTIARRINQFIKILRRDADEKNKKKTVAVIIDSIKNIYESNYLRDRYSAYYLMAISCEDEKRVLRLMKDTRKHYSAEDIDIIDYNERPNYSSKRFGAFIDTIERFTKKFEEDIDKSRTKDVQYWKQEKDKLRDVETIIYCRQNALEKRKKMVKMLQDYFQRNAEFREALFKKGISEKLEKYYWNILVDPLRTYLYLTELYSFYLQDVETCIQNADIFIADTEDEAYKPHLHYQLIRYVSLMMHPGLVLPTPVERCMQIAYTAKANSGCISRQVGAVVTDKEYQILSLGWNDVPCGQTPCLYRNLLDLQNRLDRPAYSNYEWSDEELIQSYLNEHPVHVQDAQKLLGGLPASFCFKDLHGKATGVRNPMDSRAMHAEEKALMICNQQRVRGGYLFTTSSPCEMCAKNAKEHRISKIYYIEPYPGISQKHCCESGDSSNRAQYVLFEGAIGRAYTQLYTPVLPYKDELKMRGFPVHLEKMEELTVSDDCRVNQQEVQNKHLVNPFVSNE